MSYYRITVSLLCFFQLFNSSLCRAGDTLKQHFPTVVLVQLRSEHNRVEALTKARMPKELAEVQQDAAAVSAAMICDFNAHFDVCPVYYYIDTNADLIKKKQFSGILLNDAGKVVTNVPLSDTSTRYLIAYYGYPIAQSRSVAAVSDSDAQKNDVGQPSGRGLVIMNDKFQQVNYFYKLEYDEWSFKARKDKHFYYKSRHFDIEYFPLAELFNKKLTDRYGNHRIPY